MAALFSYGLVLGVSLIIGLVFTIIGVFVGHIILFDSIFLAAISGIICNQIWSIHPALCVVIAIALFGLLFWLQNTKAGFWIIGILLSAFWAFVVGFFVHIFTGEDMLWFYVGTGLAFIVMMGLHLKARNA